MQTATDSIDEILKKLSGILQMEFHGDSSQKHRSPMGQVGII